MLVARKVRGVRASYVGSLAASDFKFALKVWRGHTHTLHFGRTHAIPQTLGTIPS